VGWASKDSFEIILDGSKRKEKKGKEEEEE
jgi:hypothetical protein